MEKKIFELRRTGRTDRLWNIEKGLSFNKNSMNIFHTKPTLHIGNAFLSRKKY